MDGWPARGDRAPVAWPLYDARQALETEWETDAHAVAYLVPAAIDADAGPWEPSPRLAVHAPGRMSRPPVLAWAMLDADRPDHTPWPSVQMAAAAVDRCGGLGGALSSAGVYPTRAGLRLIWRLACPIPIAQADGWLRAWRVHVEAETGIAVDPSSCQWTRCFRLPGAARDGVPPDARLFALANFSRMWRTPLEAGHVPPAMPLPAPPVADDENGALPHDAVLTDAEWARLADCVGIAFADRLRAGAPLAPPGARNSALLSTLGTVARALGPDRHALYAALRSSVVGDTTPGAPTLTQLWDRAGYVADRERGRRVWTSAPMPSATPSSTPSSAPVAPTPSSTPIAPSSASPPVIWYGSCYYVRDREGDYRPPVAAVALVAALEKYGPIGIQTRTARGAPLSAATILAEHGQQAVAVVAELGRKRTEWAPHLDGGTLIEKACPRRFVEPIERTDIADWLRVFAGDSVERVLDWIATIGQLGRPTCALYLHGPPGVGKGLFAAGLASLWSSAPCPYHAAVGAWTDGLLRCPLVLLDESVSGAGTVGDHGTADFRRLIGESEHRLTRKFFPSAVLRGCPRLVIATNSDDALRIRESLTMEDIQAIAERILYVHIAPEAARILRGFGGRTGTDGWATTADGGPGRIAEHAAWLEATRGPRVVPGHRYLVAGDVSDWHHDLAMYSAHGGAAMVAIMRALLRAHPSVSADGVRVGVAAAPLRASWAMLCGESPPSEVDLARTLRALSIGRETRAGTHWYMLDTTLVARAADILGIAPAEQIVRAAHRVEKA